MSADETASAQSEGDGAARTRDRDSRQSSTFVCAFCEVEDKPQALKDHLLDEHTVEIAGEHWAGHIYRIEQERERR